MLRLGDDAVGRQHKARDRGGVLEPKPRDLRRVDDAHLHEVAVFVRRDVVAEMARAGEDSFEHDRWILAGVRHDLSKRLLERPTNDAHAGVTVERKAGQAIQRGACAKQGYAATWSDALGYGRPRGMHRVLDARFLLLELGFRSTRLP